MKTRFGTSHFVSFDAACNYYVQYGGEFRRSILGTVQRKLNDQEISIGPPTTQPGDVVTVIPGEGRYQIERD